MNSPSITYTKTLAVEESYEVVVCGGGPAGTAAALAAARRGARVLLVERQAQLGGMATSGLVSHWLGGRRHRDGAWVVGGIFRELSEGAAARGWALIPPFDKEMRYSPHGWFLGLHHGIPLDPHGMALMLDEVMAEAGVRLLLCTGVVDALVKGDRIRQLVLHNKSGLHAIEARTVVDATGDADIAALSGCDHILGREEDGAMTPVTLEFHVDQVDQEAFSAYVHEHDEPRLLKLIARLKEEGIWPWETDRFIAVQLTEPGVMMLNTPRILGVDGTNGQSLTEGILRARAEIHRLMEIARAHFPGFAKARIRTVAPALGVRETRRIRGATRLTVEDVCHGRLHHPIIGLSSYGWDLPDPKRPSHQPLHGRKKPSLTTIPYGVMVPQPITNLICPGRAISVERDVLGPLRVMAPCMAMGEAAGAAAAQMLAHDRSFASIDGEALRDDLRAHGAIVEESGVVDA